jgi:hypothetical protein
MSDDRINRGTWNEEDVDWEPDAPRKPGEPLLPPDQLEDALKDIDRIIEREKTQQ